MTTSATRASISTRDDIANLLNQTDWAIISAERTNQTTEENCVETDRLGASLYRQGLKAVHVRGTYGGVQELSFFCSGISRVTALTIARVYRQESILTRGGIVYCDGRPTLPATGIVVFDAEDVDGPTDDYTYSPEADAVFTVQF